MFGLWGGPVESCAVLLHDKQQPGASSDKALIQKIPPSFAENPNEDLKCSAGGRPGGRGYTSPLLAFPAIVSLSPHWPGWDGDERDMTAWRGLRTQPPHRTRLAPWGARFHRPRANKRNDIMKEAEEQNQHKLFAKDPRDKTTVEPFAPNWFSGNSNVK